MLTGNLQIKNNKYYAVINRKVDGKRKPKWIPLGLPARGNKRQAEALLNRLIAEYEANGEGRNYPALNENGELVTAPATPDESEILFADYVQSWLKMVKCNKSRVKNGKPIKSDRFSNLAQREGFELDRACAKPS